MAGTVVVDTVKSSTSGAPVFQNTSGTQIGQLTKAWVNFNGNTAAVRASFNVTSVTRNSTGNYTITFTTTMGSANYCVTTGGCYTLNSTGERNFGVTTENYGTGTTLLIITSDMTSGAALDMEVVNVMCCV